MGQGISLKINDELRKIKEYIAFSENYSRWNTTSFDLICLGACGYYGNDPEGIEMALNELINFAAYVKTRPEQYMPSGGFIPMYSSDKVSAIVSWIQNYTPPPGMSDPALIAEDKLKGMLLFKNTITGIPI